MIMSDGRLTKRFSQDRLMHAFDEVPDHIRIVQLESSIQNQFNFPSKFAEKKSSSFNSSVVSPTQSIYIHNQEAQNSSKIPLSPTRSPQARPEIAERTFARSSRQRPTQRQVAPQESPKFPKATVETNGMLDTIHQQHHAQNQQKRKGYFTSHTVKVLHDEDLVDDHQVPVIALCSSPRSEPDMEDYHKRKEPCTLYVQYLVKRFMTLILAKRMQRLFFRKSHFQMINDKASEAKQNLTDLYTHKKINRRRGCLRKYLMRIQQNQTLIDLRIRFQVYLNHVVDKIPLVHPESKFKLAWDSFRSIIMVYFFYLVPLDVCFQNEILFGLLIYVSDISILFLILDYILKMNTVYYDMGKAVTKRNQIVNQYLGNGFFIDGFSILLLVICQINREWNINSTVNISLLFFYTQFPYFHRTITNLEEQLHLSKFQVSILNLVKLLLTIFFFVHIFSCLWYLVGQYNYLHHRYNWMEAKHIQDASWEIKYLYAFYFSTVTMLTVGYGDIVPTNSLEILFGVFIVSFGCIQLSYSVNTVGHIIKSMTQTQDAIREKLRIINAYMKEKKISFELQYQVREYLKNYWHEEHQEQDLAQTKIINQLSEDLRNQIVQEANHAFIDQSSVLFRDLSDEIKLKILKAIHSVFIHPESIFTTFNAQFEENCLCFVQNGCLDIIKSKQNFTKQVSIATLHSGSFFGQQEFLTNERSTIYYRSQQFVRLSILRRSDFLSIIRQSPKDYEKFCQIRDNYSLKLNHNSQKCESCYRKGHDIWNCPLLHYVPDREKIIKKHQFPHTQARVTTFERNTLRLRNHFSSLVDNWGIQQISGMIKEEEIQMKHFYDEVEKLTKRKKTKKKKHHEEEEHERVMTIVDLKNQLRVGVSSTTNINFSFEKHEASALDRSRQQDKYSQVDSRIADFNRNFASLINKIYSNDVINLLSHDDQTNIMLTIKKIEQILGFDKKKLTLLDMDARKDFQIYNKNNNLSHILTVKDGTYQHTNDLEQSTTTLSSIRKTLIRYMFYPFFHLDNLQKDRQNDQKLETNRSPRLSFKRRRQSTYGNKMLMS